MHFNKKKGLILSILINVSFLLFFYHANIFHPNKYLFSNHDDGLKTYYNFVWHQNDNSLLELNSTNYPYGEFILYEGSSPFFNNLKNIIFKVIPSLNDYSVAILNLIVFLSYLCGVSFLYLIFIRFALPYYLSAISANAVILLSSQILLLNPAGHFWLSLVCYFPIGWFLLIKYFESNRKIKWSLLISLNIFIWAFIHVYLSNTLIFFVAGVHLFKLIFNGKSYFNKQLLLHIFIQIFLPVILVITAYKTLDTHTDRIDMPFLIEHIATFYSVFLSEHTPLKSIYSLFFDLNKIYEYRWGEKGNYVGLIVNLSIITFVITTIILFVKRKIKVLQEFLPLQYYPYLLASILLLLLSMLIPIRLLPMDFINMLPLIKQFSGVGRFAWGFYYVVAVLSFIFIYNLLSKVRYGTIVFYILLIISFTEAVSYHSIVSKRIKIHKNPFSINHIRESEKILTKIDKNEFQAILPLPYYFKYNLPFKGSNFDNSIYASLVASTYSKLPIFSVFLSRPSVSEALSIYKMLMPVTYQKPIKQVVENGKDLAVIVYNKDTSLLSFNEKILLKKAVPYLKNSNYSILSLSIDNLLKSVDTTLLGKYHNLKDSLHNKNGWMVSDTTSFIYYNNFDTLKSDIVYKGNGALKGLKKDYIVAAKFFTQNIDTSKEYVLTFWYYNYVWDQTFNSCIIRETDSLNNTLQWISFSPVSTSLIDDWWYFSEHKFKIKSNSGNITVMFHGGNYFKNWFVADELLIYPAGKDIFRTENNGDKIYCNNKMIKK